MLSTRRGTRVERLESREPSPSDCQLVLLELLGAVGSPDSRRRNTPESLAW